MKSSPEPGRRAVLLDANVLSRLARVHQTDVLPEVFPGGCYLAPAIYHEVEASLESWCGVPRSGDRSSRAREITDSQH